MTEKCVVWAIVERQDGYIEGVYSNKEAAQAALRELQKQHGGDNYYISKERVNATPNRP